jgi:hypothetical protein
LSAIIADSGFCWIHPSGTSGLSLTAYLLSDTGASVASFTLSAAAGYSGAYTGTFPTGTAAGHYKVVIRNTSGGAYQGQTEVDWMGQQDGYLVSKAHIYDLLVKGLITDAYPILSGSTTVEVFIQTSTSIAPFGSTYQADGRKLYQTMVFWDSSTNEYHERVIDNWDYQLSSLAAVRFDEDPRGPLPFTPVSGDRAYLRTGGAVMGQAADDSIDSNAIAASAIGATQIATNAITSTKIASSAIGATQIAANAIGSSELASTAVSEIAAAIWDYSTASAVSGGSFGREFNEKILRTYEVGSVTSGSNTKEVEVSGLTVTNSRMFEGQTLAVYDASQGYSEARRIIECSDQGSTVILVVDRAFTFNPTTGDIATVIPGVWGYAKTADGLDSADLSSDVRSAMTTQGYTTTRAPYLDLLNTNLDAAISGLPTAAAIADAVWTEALADHSSDPGSTAEALKDASQVTASVIADAVWDEATSGHTTAGTFGEQAAQIDSRFDINESNQGSIVSNQAIIDANVDAILVDTGTTIPNQISALNDPTAAAIADAVWDEALAGHAIAGSTGEALTDAASGGSAPSAADIADAVWDEAVSGHTGAGSFGELLDTNVDATIGSRATQTSVDSLNDISTADVQTALTSQGYTVGRAGNLDNLDASVSSRSSQSSVDTIDGIVDSILVDTGTTIPGLISGLNDPTAAAIADQVWDEARAGHVAAGSFGEFIDAAISSRSSHAAPDLSNLDATISSRASQTSVDTVDTNVDAILVDTGTTIPGLISGLNDPSAAAIADAVWDEAIADHLGAGSTGEALNASGGGATPAAIADAVWDEAVSGHTTAGSFGELLDTNVDATISSRSSHAAPDLSNLDVAVSTRASQTSLDTVDGIVDDILVDTSTTIPAQIAALPAAPSAADIADAVWDEAAADHTTAGSFGDYLDAEVSSRATPGDIPTPPTVGAIADAVWTEALADHSGTAGSTAEALDAADAVADVSGLATSAEIAALNDPSAADIADAVWDEPKAGHVAAGSFGEEVQTHALSSEVAALNDISSADVQAALTAQGYTSPRAANLDNLDAAISTRSTFDFSSEQVRIDATSVDLVWNEDTASHSVAGTFGELLGDNLDTTVSSRASSAEIAALENLSSADVQAALTAQGYTAGRASGLDNLDAAISTRSTFDNSTDEVLLAASEAGEIADAVWDEPLAGHLASGSTGEALDGAAAPTAGQVADAVWDEAVSGHTGPGSFGALLDTNIDATIGSRSTFNPATQTVDVGEIAGTSVSGPDDLKADISTLATLASIAALNDLDATEVADAVWNAAQSSYTAAGSTGESLDDAAAAGAPDPAPIADAVWDEARAAHTTAGSFGEALDATISSRASGAALAALNDLSQADVQAALDAQGYTTARAVLQDNLDAAVSSRSNFDSSTDPVLLAGSAVDAIWDEAIADHLTVGSAGRRLADTALSFEIAALENLSAADVQAALTAQGYTAGRAALLDNLDAAVSGLSTFDPGAQEVILSAASRAAVADDVWDEAASGHSTAGSFGERLETARKHLTNRATISGAGPFTTTIFEDDGTTPLKTFTVSADKRDRSP